MNLQEIFFHTNIMYLEAPIGVKIPTFLENGSTESGDF